MEAVFESTQVLLAFFLVFLTLEDGTDRLSRNVFTELRLFAV